MFKKDKEWEIEKKKKVLQETKGMVPPMVISLFFF